VFFLPLPFTCVLCSFHCSIVSQNPIFEKAGLTSVCPSTEKPSLQSRHSLDSARLQEKEQGPLWITLALQKQKGFREQQQSREDRRSQREAKLAEKQSKERDSVCLPTPRPTRNYKNELIN